MAVFWQYVTAKPNNRMGIKDWFGRAHLVQPQSAEPWLNKFDNMHNYMFAAVNSVT